MRRNPTREIEAVHQQAPEVFPAASTESGEGELSSCGEDEGRVSSSARSLQLPCDECAQILHELSNVLTGVLVNAQVLGWKLPAYSHLKRPVHEVERNAQRGAELVKRMVRRVQETSARPADGEQFLAACSLADDCKAAALTKLDPAAEQAANLPVEVFANKSFVEPLYGAAARGRVLTKRCDPCTSGAFPKRDDSSER